MMKIIQPVFVRAALVCVVLLTTSPFTYGQEAAAQKERKKEEMGQTNGARKKIKVLVVTGGHGFDRKGFFTLFQGYDDIQYEEAVQPKAQAKFSSEAAKEYDVLVFYDMWQKIGEKQKQDFVKLLEGGKGLVMLHHSLASYQKWGEFTKIAGGKYHLQKRVEGGVEKQPSGFKHGVKFKVLIADKNHPVARGLEDFEIKDEVYNKFYVDLNVHVLLTTTRPLSGKILGWAHTYGKSRIVYIQMGHGAGAYKNESYRRLLTQAIRWVAAR